MSTVTPIDQSSDQEIFDAAIAPEAPVAPEPTPTPEAAPEPSPAPVETTGGRLKDPVTGKFVAKADKAEKSESDLSAPAEPQETAVSEADIEADIEPTMPANVPSWRLAEEAQRRRDAEAQNSELTQALRQMQMQMAQIQQAQQQQPQEQIDPIADPEGYNRNVQATLQKEIQSIRLESNLQIAQFRHGEVFDKAYEAFVENSYKGDQATYLRVMRSPNPGEAMVTWFKERETFAKIGTDPDAWLKSELEKRMADPAFQAEVIKRFQSGQGNGATPPQTTVQIPPSLSRVTSAAPSVEATQEITDEGLWNYATAKR